MQYLGQESGSFLTMTWELSETKLKFNELISLDEMSRLYNIGPVTWLSLVTVTKYLPETKKQEFI